MLQGNEKCLMREIDKILLQIEQHIQNSTYTSFETDKLELKDLSGGGDWKELYKSVCAFLNTKGGIVIVGIKEDTQNKQLKFTGYNPNNESKIKDLPKIFTDDEGKKLDLTEYVNPNWIEIKPFLSGQIALIFVEKLPDEEKFIFFEKNAYERQGTGDHKIDERKIQLQNERKRKLKDTIELDFVPNASIEDIDLDKLNDYITKLNSEIKIETLKPNIESAIPFLERKKFIRQKHPTLLGMLVCGRYIEDFLGNKCEIDAYFETNNNLADDKKIYKNNIIPLMESAWNFVFSKISTGVSVEKGGIAVYEYPQSVIRETINNALAHRDYRIDNFCMLRVKNNKFLEIKNPGKFKQEQLIFEEKPIKIRRVIPFPNRQNPNLADVLKVYNRYEGRGVGMATLTQYAIENQIDVPYYKIHPNNELSLFVVAGKVLDNNAINWLKSFQKYIFQKTNGRELSQEEKTILAYFYKSEKHNETERYTINLSSDNNHFEVIKLLLKDGLLEVVPYSRTEIQVYKLDDTLKKENFTEELRNIFGGAFDELNLDTKKILEAIYHQNWYSTSHKVSASLIGDFLYFKTHTNSQIDLREYGNFKRKVRAAVGKLLKQGFILEKGKADYAININFERTKSLFD